MRSSIRAVSLFPAVLAAALSGVLAAPAFASGEDKPAAPSSATASGALPTAPTAPAAKAARPDREKKVYTNDDIDQMWPKAQASASDSQSYPASAYTVPVARRPAAVSSAVSAGGVASAPPSRENNPVWYAAQIESLYAELDSISARKQACANFARLGRMPA